MVMEGSVLSITAGFKQLLATKALLRPALKVLNVGVFLAQCLIWLQ